MLKETHSKLLSLGRDTVRRGGNSARALWNNASGKYSLSQPLFPYTLRVKAISPDKTHTHAHYSFRVSQSKDDIYISSISRNETINPTSCYKLTLATIPEIHCPSSFLKHWALNRHLTSIYYVQGYLHTPFQVSVITHIQMQIYTEHHHTTVKVTHLNTWWSWISNLSLSHCGLWP